MKIDRHNYEEYFILYMDNELSSDDRRMLEVFVQQHPDLKEELDLLVQYKLTPDTTVTYPGKEELMKVNNETPVTISNYEEWLVLYMDNELTAAQKEIVGQFIAANPSLKEEFALLQLTKLQPEQIVFTPKESLYRKEEKVRAIPVLWWRVAAAILILAVGLTTVIVLNNKPSGSKETDVVTLPVDEQKGTVSGTVLPEKKNNSVKNVVAENVKQSPVQNISNQERNNIAVKNNTVVPANNLSRKNPVQVKKEDEVIAENNNKSNNIPQPLNNPNVIKNDASKNDVATIPKEISNPKKSSTDIVVTNTNSSPSNIVNASYAEDNADLNQPSDKKTKLRGFFRKITRTFEKRTNMDPTDDNKLLVAGLAFKLK